MTAELRKTYFRYLIAFVLTALSATLGNILDGVIVGQLVGPVPLPQWEQSSR